MKLREYAKLRLKGQSEITNSDGKSEKMSFSWWLQDNTDGDNPDCHRLKVAFVLWRNCNWLVVLAAWCNLGTTLATYTWLNVMGHVFLHPWGNMWKMIGAGIAFVFANVIANMSDKDDQRVAVPTVILLAASAVSFLLKGSNLQLGFSIVDIVSIIWEKLKTDKYRSKLQRTTPTAKVKRVTLPNGEEIVIQEMDEKVNGKRPPHH